MVKFLTNKTTYETIIRYLLGLAMLPYGLTKIMRTQFVVLPFHQWSVPLKDISGATLTWAFLGYSPWFTILLGLLETIPAILLLFRKTKLIGALLLFPVILNVFLINIALDLWPSTQQISAILLLMNIALLLFHHQLLREAFTRILNHVLIAKRRVFTEALINITLICTVTCLFVYELNEYLDQRNVLTGDWYNQRPNYWLAKNSIQHYSEFNYRSITDEHDYVRYYFQPNQSVYKVVPGARDPIGGRYELDEGNHSLTVYDGNDTTGVMRGLYRKVNENTIEWRIGPEEKIWLSRQQL